MLRNCSSTSHPAARSTWLIASLIAGLLGFVSTVPAFAAELKLPEKINFNEHVRPIFTKHCTACHGGVKQAGALSLVYEESVGGVVAAGAPEDSYLLERVAETDDDMRMPPPEHGPPLSKTEVALIRRWIEQGANWSGHWAYEPPKSYPAPKVADADWPRQPFDHFVLAKLEQENIKPAPAERDDRWLRRVSLDLTGLPPTLEERAEFLTQIKQVGEQAYEDAVDRLLASPRFGERWASVWFDLVRYADSRGQGEDSPRDIWKYRDWVIDSFNRDLSYDQFTIKQLAGDLLPNRTIEDQIATSVHRLTHTNEEGGTDDEEFRVAAVLDRIHTTWQTWQATTMGCVQCHSHPYDPFRHEDYYRSMAFFNNTADVDLSDDWPTTNVPLNQDDYRRASDLDQEITARTQKLWQAKWHTTHQEVDWQPLRIAKAKSSNQTKVVIENKANHDEYHTVGTVSSGPQISVELPLGKQPIDLTGIRVSVLPLNPEQALPDAEVGFVMSHVKVSLREPGKKDVEIKIADIVGDEPHPYDDPMESLNPESRNGFGAYTRMHHQREVVLLPESPLKVSADATLVVKIHYRVFNLAAFSLVARRAYYSVSSDPRLTAVSESKSLREQAERLAQLRKQRDAIDSIATPVMVERPNHLARPSHLFVRGLFLTKDKPVLPGIPAALTAANPEVPDRLALAEWLVSEDNPLTARVAVNRFWARMFGIGIVATEEDFGSAGDPPSHPEMLDDLAIRFRDNYGWSVKKLLREIALSSTYRQSSRIRPELLEQDAANRLLARGPRHSLPAETLRDQFLLVSGLLSPKMHGPPVYPPLPPGVWKARRGKWSTAKPGDEDRYRRSVYTYVKRSVPFPMFASFDAPSRDACMPKRLRSNTPLQALMLLNDAAFVECSQAFAKLMIDHSDDIKQQISYGFLRATSREPRPEEVDRLVELYEASLASAGESGAMPAVAAVLLNLDEAITK